MMRTSRSIAPLVVRIAYAALLLLLAIIGPWWLFALFLTFGILSFRAFVEGVCAALLHDALFGASLPHRGNLDSITVIGAILLLAAASFFRDRLRTARYAPSV